jgi:hypothetical protein
VDAAGIYVTDKSNSRIVRISDLTGAGWTTLGSLGERRGQFNLPWGDLCSVTAQKNSFSRALRSAVAFRAICDSTFASLSGPGYITVVDWDGHYAQSPKSPPPILAVFESCLARSR